VEATPRRGIDQARDLTPDLAQLAPALRQAVEQAHGVGMARPAKKSSTAAVSTS
jgi:hypothetical protein